jgi:hypothetical protein
MTADEKDDLCNKTIFLSGPLVLQSCRLGEGCGPDQCSDYWNISLRIEDSPQLAAERFNL